MEELLKEFWPVVIFIAISVISAIRNASKSSQQGNGAEKQPQDYSVTSPEEDAYDNPQTLLSDKAKTRRPEGNRSVTTSVADDAPVVSASERGAKVPLKGKSDVKKAFIYSEIFKRKYT
jgi:hypothetical protein